MTDMMYGTSVTTPGTSTPTVSTPTTSRGHSPAIGMARRLELKLVVVTILGYDFKCSGSRAVSALTQIMRSWV